jgi:hypothetical protein
VTAFITIFGFTRSAEAVEKVFPFHPGERWNFEVRWNFIPAGEAVLEVLPIEIINGIRSYHFVMTARTNSFIDIFHMVRDRVDSYTDVEMTHSILSMRKSQGDRKKDVVVNFNWEAREAQYSNFGEKREPIPILQGSFDPLSVYYAFTLHDLKVGDEIKIPVTNGRRCVIGRAKVMKRETVTIESGTYDTFLVEPDLRPVGGVFERSKDAKFKVWVTTDARRIPVRLESELIIGSFIGELVSVEKVCEEGSVSAQQ